MPLRDGHPVLGIGADATGVDISDEAVALARELNDELGLGARFIRSDVLTLPDVLDETFDVVYTAMGVLAWLPDLAQASWPTT